MVPFLMIFLGDFLMTIYNVCQKGLCHHFIKTPDLQPFILYLPDGDFQFTRFALSLNKIGCTSEIKIKICYTHFYFIFHSVCTIFVA